MRRKSILKSFGRWTVGAGIFNIVAALPLAIPFLFRPYYALYNQLNGMLGLGGKDLAPPVDGANMLFVNTAGLVLVLIGALLICAGQDLEHRMCIPVLNGIARLVFTVILLYYLVTQDISRILLFLAVVDVVITGAFFYHAYQLRMTQRTAA